MALDLGHKKWTIRFGDGRRIRDAQCDARDLDRLGREIEKAREKFGLDRSSRIVSCYEAGWDGFWLHRYLLRKGIENLVVDSSSIEVNRRSRRAKTDKLDAAKLLEQLLRHDRGERVWSVVRVPSVADEDARQPHRELDRLKRERRRSWNRIQGLLVSQGVAVLPSYRKLPQHLSELRSGDGSPLGPHLQAALARECERLELVEVQIKSLETQRLKQTETPTTITEEKASDLLRMKAIGQNASWVLCTEVFGWREFSNGKQLGSYAGMTPTPYSSGTDHREQGIDKSGNGRVRRLMVQIGWCWLRYQPQSALAKWYQKRFGGGGSRLRRIGIVALARKLLIALWHWVEHGVIPDGAIVEPVSR
jgi:transposase